MRKGFLVYKCRRCGELQKSHYVQNGTLAVAVLVADAPGFAKIEYAGTGGLLSAHECGEGQIGVTDLIGFEPEEKKGAD